ncbi:MAG TPA: ATP-binding protein [Pyrinomonadaceae bacterium]|nr:ATP-binding protein [Pyrinomonadaceae bacterium]
MADASTWQAKNEAYLAKAFALQRLRLTRFAQSRKDGAVPYDEQAANANPEELQAELETLERESPPPAVVVLSRLFNLSRFERDLLLLCAGMELDTNVSALCARAQSDSHRPYPTFALALALFDEPAWDVLSPERPLRRWRLIEINQPGHTPLTVSPLRADERIVNYIKGLNYLDDRLAPMLFPLNLGTFHTTLPASQKEAVDLIVRQLRRERSNWYLPLIQLAGADVQSKQLVASHATSALGLRLLRLPAALMPTHAPELETLARLIEREMALWPFAIYVDQQDLDRSALKESSNAQALQRLLARSNGIFFIDTQDVNPDFNALGRGVLTLDIGRPTPVEQQLAWREVLGENSGDAPIQLASQFDLNISSIHEVMENSTNGSSETKTIEPEHVWDACLAITRPRLDVLAQNIKPKATWDDIVLPEAELSLLRQIAGQVGHRHTVYEEWGFAAKRTRGLSINALFAGESGTGKTMAAEVIANHLRLNLFRIDLSAVVSKYIGETEKNLRRLFDAAEDGGAILFFDEADALFGKRSEVKDSHDRYANIEINYLLQRIESYRGLAILATNMKSSLDQAFMRRIRFIVEFAPHGHAERKAIWQRIFPPQTRIIGLDYGRLANLNINGGSINNVAINAAFLAAQAGTPVTMSLVLQAARNEFLKLKRPFNSDDFSWQEEKAATA